MTDVEATKQSLPVEEVEATTVSTFLQFKFKILSFAF